MKCGGCPVSGECRGEKHPYLCHLVAFGRKDYIPLLTMRHPPLAEQVVHLATDLAEHVSGGMRNAPEAIIEERTRKCEGEPGGSPCVYFENGRCLKCGCYLAVRRRWAAMACPEGFWGPVISTDEESQGGA